MSKVKTSLKCPRPTDCKGCLSFELWGKDEYRISCNICGGVWILTKNKFEHLMRANGQEQIDSILKDGQ